MATKKTTKRAAGVAKAKKVEQQVAATQGMVASSTLESTAAETLVEVLTQEEIGKAKTLVFGFLASQAAKSNAQAMFFGKFALVLDVAGKVLTTNLEAVNSLFAFKVKKMGSDIKSRFHNPQIQAQPGASVSPRPPPTQVPGPRPSNYKGKHPRHGQPGQRPLTQSMAEKLRQAGHVPTQEQPAAAPVVEEQKPEQTPAP